MSYIPRICDIYKGTDFYNSTKNVIRISTKFDKNDIDDLIFDVPLVSLGIFKDPDYRFHRVLVFFPEGIEKRHSINNPTTTEIGLTENVVIPLGLLIDNKQYKKVMGSIGNSAFSVDTDVGTQDIGELDFFIPVGHSKYDITKEFDSEVQSENEFLESQGETPIDQDLKVCGIAGSKDGGILIRGVGGEISIGPKGIRISGPVLYSDASHEKTGITKEKNTILSLIPQTVVTPFPNQLPHLQKALNIAGIITSATDLISKVK